MQDQAIMLIIALVAIPFALTLLKHVIRSLTARIGQPTLPGKFRAQNPYVIDGDTLSIAGKRIRLAGIDAPERGQRQGRYATEHLQHLLASGSIEVVPLTYDKYGRIVARVLCNRIDICRQMVVDGYAVSDPFSKSYKSEMRSARRRRKGLWASGSIEDPRAFRNARAA